ncbi:MAG: hypothetical protein K0Q68_1752 [Moraxellaceae bacterium]|jgi:hypothetical protein|nr:hypothetical protein [Moraxellaceae bacterium]
MKKGLLLLPLLAALLGGCHVFSGTRVEEVVSQPPVPATLGKLLVVGITTTPAIQADMEQALARELGKQGRQVVLASQWFPGEKAPLRDEVVQRVKAEGVTGVLAVRLLSYEVADPQAPVSGFSLHAPARAPGARVGWEQDPWLDGPQQGMDLPQRKAAVETRLYDVATGKVVWEARSRTLLRSDAREELEGFVHAILMELRKSGWLRKP